MTEVFGSVYAALYDGFYEEKDYAGETELLTQIFHRYARRPVKKVLDLGCGTGNHAVQLASRGFEVTGVDRSKEMLAIAGQKASPQAQRLRFLHGDIRNLDLRETFDAALMMFAVLGYQRGDADVRSVLQTARHHVCQDGLLVFDVWYGPAVEAQGPEGRVRTIEQNGITWSRSVSGRLDARRHLCHVDFNLRHAQGGRLIGEATEQHIVRYFFPEEIGRFLKDSSFRLLRLGGFPSSDREPDHTTWNVMAVAVAV